MNYITFLPQQWTKLLAQRCANGFSEVHWRLFVSKTLTKTFRKFAWSSSNWHLAGNLLRMYTMKRSPFGEAKLFTEFWIFTVVKAVFCVGVCTCTCVCRCTCTPDESTSSSVAPPLIFWVLTAWMELTNFAILAGWAASSRDLPVSASLVLEL